MYWEGVQMPSRGRKRLAAGIEYELTRRKGMKRIKLAVKPPEGRVCVSASPIERTGVIDDFVASHAEWIANARDEIARLPRRMPVGFSDGEQVSLWGDPLVLKIIAVHSGSVTVSREGGEVVVSAPPGSKVEELEAAYEGFLSREVSAVLDGGLLDACEKRTGLRCSCCSVRRMTSRWGSCTYSTGRIRISSRLALYPKSCLEMVVIHELGHLVHRGHGPDFKRFMDERCPGWRQTRVLLRD